MRHLVQPLLRCCWAGVHGSGRPPQGGPDPWVLQPSTGAAGRLGCPLAKTSSQPLGAVSRWRRRRRILVGWVVRRPAMAMDGKHRNLAEEEEPWVFPPGWDREPLCQAYNPSHWPWMLNDAAASGSKVIAAPAETTGPAAAAAARHGCPIPPPGLTMPADGRAPGARGTCAATLTLAASGGPHGSSVPLPQGPVASRKVDGSVRARHRPRALGSSDRG